MPLRFVDLDSRASPYKDFVVRRRSPTLAELFMTCGLLILTGEGILLVSPNPVALSSLLFTIIGIACLYALTHVNLNRQLLQTTEFQNALFASALTKGYTFCLMVSQEGTITYSNPAFVERFASVQIGDSIGEWLAVGKVSGDGRIELLNAIGQGTANRLALMIEADDKRRLSLALTVEPILRPAGFVLIRCTEQAGIAK